MKTMHDHRKPTTVLSRREFLAGLALLPALTPGAPADAYLKVLGTAQDGGYPQVGTYDARNDRARRNRRLARRVASVALLNPAARRCYLVDATPDLPSQLEMLRETTFLKARGSRDLLDGILLTHAHMGHYTGLMFLGLEAMNTRRLPIHCTRRMAEFLSHNGPWDLLLKRDEIDLQVFETERETELDAALRFRAIRVTHREEYTDTVGFVLGGPRRTVFYLPDVDSWSPALTEVVRSVDLALIDGTFFDDNEIPGVDMSRFPHPRVLRMMDELNDLREKVYFTHLNNSNPAVDPSSAARRRIHSRGFHLAEDGLELPL